MAKWILALAFVLGGCDACKQVSGQCCKTCTDSKPCGDSCISRTQTCNKGGGCACSGIVESVLEE